MRNRPRNRASESGFTLIEVMIALVIMGIGLLTIAVAQLTAMRMSSHSKHTSDAMYLAEQQMEAFVVNVPIAAGTFNDPANPIDINPADDDFSNFNRSWTVQPNVPRAGMSTVTVVVVWNSAEGGATDLGPGRRTVQLQGIVGP